MRCYMSIFLTALIFLLSIPLNGDNQLNAVWWEGENTIKNDFVESPWLQEKIKKTRLSKMKWLNCLIPPEAADKKEFYSAEYEVEVPNDSEYHFWAREFYRPTASSWKYRFDGGEWIEVKKEHPYWDIADLGRDRSAVWCEYDKIKLKKGKHKLNIRIYPKKKGDFLAGFDCFLLIDMPFAPSGWKKPEALAAQEYLGTFIWIEGEDAESNFRNVDNTIIMQEDRKLSNEKWLTCYASADKVPQNGFRAKWKFIVPISGTYHFWIREYCKSSESSFRYRFNEWKWANSNPDMPYFDTVQLSGAQSVCWVNHDRIFLSEGENCLEIEITDVNASANYLAAFDCFCLSIEPFFSQGKNKPDALPAEAPEGWFTFKSPVDSPDSKKSAFDLRCYNDERAGIHGHCRVDEKGLIFEDGTRLRFWGINTYQTIKMSRDDVKYFVRHMAKFGVNLIRIHGPLSHPNSKAFGEWDVKLLNQLHYFVAACREMGIYVVLSHYSPPDYEVTKKMGLEGYDAISSKPPFGLLMINENFREIYKKWTSFLEEKNPYTGVSLAEDSAVLWFEIQNEDSLFFWTSEQIPPEQMQLVENSYNNWLKKQYGGEVYILQEWSIPGEYHPVIAEDGRKDNRIFKIMKTGTLTRKGTSKQPQHQKRKRDQIRFISETQKESYKNLIDFLRNKRGLKCLISAGNWTTVDPFLLDGVERWTYMPGDIMDRHAFLNSLSQNSSPYIINEGQEYLSISALLEPFMSPAAYPVYPGKANVVSEVGWPSPNEYRSEAVPFISAYASLHGAGTYIWFTTDAPSWVGHISKFSVQTPATMGLFPGYALMFRRGDIQEGKTVLKQFLNIKEQFNFKGCGFELAPPMDYLPPETPSESEKGISSKTKQPSVKSEYENCDPAAFFIGKVERGYTQSAGSSDEFVEFSQYHNPNSGTIHSTTEELKLNYKTGVLTINTLRSQAAIGFLKQADIQNLRDVDIKLNNEYGNILVTALDNNPISESKHILVQAMTREKNLGWQTCTVKKGESTVKLLNTGDIPIIVERISGYVLFHNKQPENWEAWKLDPNGYRTGKISISQLNSGLKLDLPQDALYVELIQNK